MHSYQLNDNENSPDWADLLAAQWMDAIKVVYQDKGLGKNKIHAPIVNIQGQAFASGINGVYNDVDFNSPDYYLREVLKQNTWQFSVAKNYNDQIQLNNLLLDENGALRSWADFKREAQKIVGDSIKYLQTEHNTIIAAAQMSRIWAEIQRDKHIFPYVQIIIVKDGRTSDICEPLADLIFEVDDPILMYYFPPNHFNCRTTVKKLRYGVPSVKFELPDIPDAFKNNTGASGKIFTNDNLYIKNTPEEVLTLSEKFYDDNQYKKDIELLMQDDRWKKAYEDVKATNLTTKYPNMTIEEITTIQHYTNMGYWDLNEALYTGRVFPLEEANERILNKALAKLPKTDKNLAVRGMPFNNEIYKKYADNIGQVLINEGFTSTTTNEEIAKAFGQDEPTMIFYIKHKNGKELKDISFFSETFGNDDEFEILFKSKTKFKVKEIVPNEEDFEIYLEEVD